MNNYEWDENIAFEAWAKRVEEASPYKRKPSAPDKWMSVTRMGQMLGLKKTDRYWLVHKNYFRTEVIHGQMRVDIKSFEKWYANQIKYKKVTGEEPGLELKERSYSVRDIAQMLSISESLVYDILKKDNVKTILVDYWKRVPKEEFWKWYENQDRYRTKEDREKYLDLEEATMSMPDMARALGVPRSTVYSILKGETYGDLFTFITLAGQKRIYKRDFERFLRVQDEYSMIKVPTEEIAAPSKTRKEIEDRNYYTVSEAAYIAGVTPYEIKKLYTNNEFPYVKAGSSIRIPKNTFILWMRMKGDAESNGND